MDDSDGTPNPLVNRPTVIVRFGTEGWIAQFAGSRVEMALPSGSLHEVVEHLRHRWPNARLAFDEAVLSALDFVA